MLQILRLRRRKPDYAHIAQLERENGIDDGTFTDEWVADIQERLDEAGIGAPPKKRELFTPPILERHAVPLLTSSAVAKSSASPGATLVTDGLLRSGYAVAHKAEIEHAAFFGARPVIEIARD